MRRQRRQAQSIQRSRAGAAVRSQPDRRGPRYRSRLGGRECQRQRGGVGVSGGDTRRGTVRRDADVARSGDQQSDQPLRIPIGRVGVRHRQSGGTGIADVHDRGQRQQRGRRLAIAGAGDRDGLRRQTGRAANAVIRHESQHHRSGSDPGRAGVDPGADRRRCPWRRGRDR